MKRPYILLLVLFALAATIKAQAPSGYYDSANGLTGDDLRAALHNIIKNDKPGGGTYNPSYDGIWTAFQTTDVRPNGKVWDIYSSYQYTFGNNQCGSYDSEGDCYNREHLWAQSWTNDDGTEQTDLHHVFPSDGYVNNKRGNYALGEVGTVSWTSSNGSKLGTCSVSGYNGTVFEPIDEYKGDIARALMYVSVRYYNEDSGWGTSGMTDKSVIKDWAIAMLLQWHHADPVSDKEIARNNAVYSIQQNRNPFVDNPVYADMIWDPTWSATYDIAVAANPTVGGEAILTVDGVIDFSAQGYSNSQEISSAALDTNVSVAFDKGTNSNQPKYFTSGSAIRCYGGNYFTVTASSGKITNIGLIFGSSDGSNAITTNVGSYSNGTWTGEATSVRFTINGSSGNRRLKGISVTYSIPGTVAQQVTVPAGATAMLTATANTGYHFVNWTKGGVEVSKNNPYSFTVNASGTYIANFEINTYDIDVATISSEYGIVYIGDAPTPESDTTKSIDFSAQGYANEQTISNAPIDSNVSVEFDQGTNTNNAPAYFNTGAAIRCYAGNYFVVNAGTKFIKSITLSYGSGDYSNEITTNVGTIDGTTWTGNAKSVTFTIGGTSKHRRIHALSVTYTIPGTPAVTHTTVTHGSTVSITAVPDDDYFFTNWTKGNDVVSPNPNYEFTVTANGNYVANFIPATISENTTIQSLTMGENTTLTINSGAILTVSGTITQASSAKIVIEDGCQLVNSTSGINAKVKKNITEWTTTPSKNGWHAIATPVNNVTFANVTNLTNVNYDIFRLNETNLTWENSQDSHNIFSSFVNGRGYIYRKANNTAIEFNGTLNVSSVTYPLTYTSDATKGFHLVGNPYPHNIYKGDNAAIPNDYLEGGFYTITSAGGFVAGTDNSTAIAPCQAILVQALNTVVNENLIITKTTATGVNKDFDDNIMFAVSNSNYEDVAYAVFKKGHGLNKIEHRNEDIQKLYIQHNGEDFAIADIDEDVQAFNLNFRAATTGRYTMQIKPVGSFSYLHLIDAITGEDIDLLLDDKYSFIGTPSDKENRFIVKLDHNTSGSSTGSETFAYESGNEIVVEGDGELQIYDITGRMVANQRVTGVEMIEKPSSTGVYIFRLIGNEVRVQKIIVK